MSSRLRVIGLAWVSIAILLRLYGINGGDAAIVGGLLFLVWTAPFGMIWQFYLYDYVLAWMPAFTAQIIGDVIVIVIGFLFWFVFIPRLRNMRSMG
jgi:hypothetical protein